MTENDERFIKFQKNLEAAYKRTFRGDNKKVHAAATEVLADLKIYCNATRSNFSPDALEMARGEGRREVFLYIMDYLELDVEYIHKLENAYLQEEL